MSPTMKNERWLLIFNKCLFSCKFVRRFRHYVGNGSFTAFKDERLTMPVVVSIQSQLFITHLYYILRYNSEVIG